MTDKKRPLPSLRFVIYLPDHRVMRLIPQTTPKGIVIPGLWALPGGRIKTTDWLKACCKREGWRFEITGSDGSRKRGRRSEM